MYTAVLCVYQPTDRPTSRQSDYIFLLLQCFWHGWRFVCNWGKKGTAIMSMACAAIIFAYQKQRQWSCIWYLWHATQYNATFNSLLNCIRSLVKFIFIMSNFDININCPAITGFSLSLFCFSTSISPEKNADNSPAALSIVMELWKYYKSCTFIRVNRKKTYRADKYPARPWAFITLIVCKYGHNGNVKSRFSQNGKKRKNTTPPPPPPFVYTMNKRRKEKWIHYIDGYLLEFIAFFVGVNEKKYGQIKGENPFHCVTIGNVRAVDISLFMLIMSTLYTSYFQKCTQTQTHPSPLLFNGILFALISPENAH